MLIPGFAIKRGKKKAIDQTHYLIIIEPAHLTEILTHVNTTTTANLCYLYIEKENTQIRCVIVMLFFQNSRAENRQLKF